jgi:hypothetical protein
MIAVAVVLAHWIGGVRPPAGVADADHDATGVDT